MKCSASLWGASHSFPCCRLYTDSYSIKQSTVRADLKEKSIQDRENESGWKKSTQQKWKYPWKSCKYLIFGSCCCKWELGSCIRKGTKEHLQYGQGTVNSHELFEPCGRRSHSVSHRPPFTKAGTVLYQVNHTELPELSAMVKGSVSYLAELGPLHVQCLLSQHLMSLSKSSRHQTLVCKAGSPLVLRF